MTKVSIDTSEMRAFAVDIRKASSRVRKDAPAVVDASAKRIENHMRSKMAASKSFAPVAKAITTSSTHAGMGAEIGAEKGKPGSLANIAYFAPAVSVYRGGPKWRLEVGRGPGAGGGTVEDPRVALEAEAPTFEKNILNAGVGSFS